MAEHHGDTFSCLECGKELSTTHKGKYCKNCELLRRFVARDILTGVDFGLRRAVTALFIDRRRLRNENKQASTQQGAQEGQSSESAEHGPQ